MPSQLALAQLRTPTTTDDILHVMKHQHEQGVPNLSRSDIAQLVERKVTPRLIGLIEELHQSGKVQRGVAVWPNGAQGYVYALTGGKDAD